jgi:hypothetical protein
MRHLKFFVLVALVLAVLSSATCGGGAGPKTTPPPTFTIGAAVTGFSSGTLVLQNNGGNDLTISGNGTFMFTNQVSSGATYKITVLTQPTGESCSLGSNSTGTASANVVVAVTCAASGNFTVSATVTGLTGTLVLQDNASDNLTITTNGSHPFATQIAAGATYSVSVLTQPSGQTCSLGSNSSGTATADVAVSVTCAATSGGFTISAAVTGLTGTLVLQDNGGDNLTITANGTFPFATQIVSGATYNVTVLTQPSGQTCSLGNSSGTANANVTVTVTCNAINTAFGVYTNKNDNARTGQNLQETVLTPQNVNVNSFGKLFSYPVDGTVQTQPLYASNVYVPLPLNGTTGSHNVVYFATANDTVYAYDADGLVQTGPLWKTSFVDPPTVVPVPGSCVDANVQIIGVTPTPVIDPNTNTMYVEARTLENPTDTCTGTYVHRLHALDIATGQEKFGGPKIIEASVPGTGEGSVNGVLEFDPQKENSRPGLLLSQSSQDTNSVVYMATASNQDTQPYHGWVLGYDSQTLAQKYVYNSTPNGGLGGVWQMGGGLAADADGNIFVLTGNGTFDNVTDFAQSALKLRPNAGSLTLADYYTPSNYVTLNKNDWDVSSGGVLLLPDQPGNNPHLMVGGGKEGTIYVMNRDNLGGYQVSSDNIVQYIVGAIEPSVAGGTSNGIWNTPSYFNGNVYIFGQHDFPKMFTLNNGLLPTTASSTGNVVMRSPAAMISANGTSNGIVWMLQYDTAVPVLWAYNANDLTEEYYDTTQNAARDKVATRAIARVNPTIANGRVYVPASNSVLVYGLLP